MFKQILTVVLLSSLVGCKLTVLVPRGGDVLSSGSGTCLELMNCLHDIEDTQYLETFTASPAFGFEFARWNQGDGFLCGNSTSITCVVDSSLLSSLPNANALIATSPDVYLMPIFVEAPQDITDTVIADGKEWAQVDLFANNISWNDVDSVCPQAANGVCTGSLRGYNMNGWVWASFNDMVSLLENGFGAVAPQFTGFYEESNSTWAPAILALFRPTRLDSPVVGSERVNGFIRDSITFPAFGGSYSILDAPNFDLDRGSAGPVNRDEVQPSLVGAFFHRPAP